MMIESIIIVAMLVALIIFAAQFIFGSPSESVAVLDESPGTEITDVSQFMSSMNFTQIIIGAGVIAVVSLLVAFAPEIIEKFIDRSYDKKVRRSSREGRLGSRFKSNDEGYNAAKYLVATADILDKIYNFESEEFGKKLDLTKMKMDEILSLYLADRETFGIPMYKYEDTFKIACETAVRYVRSSRTEDIHFIEVINDLIEIPYEEIVKEEGSKWLYDKGKYESDVIRRMKEVRGSAN